MQTAFDTPFEQRLASIDLARVMEHVVEDHGLSAAEAAEAEDLYRKFLTLKHRYPGQIFVPPLVVDYVWHAHITFTRQYMADCDKLFGAYMHHEPGEIDNLEGVYQQGTLAKLESDFGVKLDISKLSNRCGTCI